MHTLTHWIGSMLICLGSGSLITLAALTGDPWKIVSVSIFCASMITLYIASTLYHVVVNPAAKRRLRIFDHISIYILIAGTYTPFLLVNLRGRLGWWMFGIIWALALGGVIKDIFIVGKHKKLSTAIYLGMGWISVFCVKYFVEKISVGGLAFIALGGLFYSAGCYFYIRKDKIFYHGVWHLFVLAGTIMHFFAVLFGTVLY
jgi:hemolysin III